MKINCVGYFILLNCIVLVTFCANASAQADQCQSPYDYIQSVYSSGGKIVKYSLNPDFEYKKIRVELYGARNVTKSVNKIIRLDGVAGTFDVPSAALDAGQQFFNFVITDKSGCERWGIVTNSAISEQGNIIIIGEPTKGEGDAFFLRP